MEDHFREEQEVPYLLLCQGQSRQKYSSKTGTCPLLVVLYFSATIPQCCLIGQRIQKTSMLIYDLLILLPHTLKCDVNSRLLSVGNQFNTTLKEISQSSSWKNISVKVVKEPARRLVNITTLRTREYVDSDLLSDLPCRFLMFSQHCGYHFSVTSGP